MNQKNNSREHQQETLNHNQELIKRLETETAVINKLLSGINEQNEKQVLINQKSKKWKQK